MIQRGFDQGQTRHALLELGQAGQWVKLQQEISDHFTKEVKDQNITPELIARTMKFMERGCSCSADSDGLFGL